MKLVKCGKCGAQFDVASMRPGSSFACGKCRSPVAVPAEASPATVAFSPDQMRKALDEARAAAPAAAASPAAKAQPKLPPAMQARAQATTSAGSGRAAGSAPAQPPAAAAAPPTAPPPRAARQRDDSPDAVNKPPVALYASIAGVVVIGIAAYVMMSGDKGKESAKAPEPVKPAETAPAQKPKDPTKPEEFLTMTQEEQQDALMQRLVASETDIGKLQQFHVWLNDPKVAANAQVTTTAARVVQDALKLDGNADWARIAKGDHKIQDLLQPCVDQCTKAFQMQDPEEIAIVARLKTVGTTPWADTAEFAKFTKMVAKVRARDDRMKKDPRYLQAENRRNWVRGNPMFKTVELTWLFEDPNVIFQEVRQQDVRDTERTLNAKTGEMEEVPKEGTSNPGKVAQNLEWAKKGELFVKRDAIIFNELDRRFRELFAAEYKLPTLREQGRVLTGLVMWNRRSFDALLEEAKQPVTASIRAFYSPPQQKIFHYIGDESLQNLDEIKCEGGYVQKTSDQVTFHEGTHQLQHEYSAIVQGAPLKDGDTNVADRKAMWFEEGIAEFMGAPEVEDGKTEFLQGVHWRHNRILLSRILESRGSRVDVELWKIKDFMKPNNNGELTTEGNRLKNGDGNMGSHFYCRSWAFCHFLWYYDNGHYRPQFLRYFGEVLQGTQSSAKFAKIMKRPNVNDWGTLEKEYEWYWGKLLSRHVGKHQSTGQWEMPSTEAPTGKVEDDADFCEAWDETHKGGGEKK